MSYEPSKVSAFQLMVKANWVTITKTLSVMIPRFSLGSSDEVSKPCPILVGSQVVYLQPWYDVSQFP